jgi:sulfur-oxidizing protein SoxB
VWDLVERWLRARQVVPARTPNVPRLLGVERNPGLG